MLAPMTTTGRWLSAQEQERQFWEDLDWQKMSGAARHAEWSRHLAELGLPIDRFANQDVLDVGCGPTGIGYFLDTRRGVGLDPLADLYEQWHGFFGRSDN
jgi:hypothetical protein